MENVPIRRSAPRRRRAVRPCPRRARRGRRRRAPHPPAAAPRSGRHSALISPSGAMSPSIEKTPSTATRTPPPSSWERSSIFSSFSSRLWRNGRILARESRHPSRIEAWSPGVDDDGVGGAEQRPEHAEVRLVAGREDERVLRAHPVGDLALEFQVQRDRAVEQARARQARPEALQRVLCALHDPLVAGQAEIVVGAEHDPLGALHLDDRHRRGVKDMEVGQDVRLPGGGEHGLALVAPDLCEDVDRGLHVVCPRGGGRNQDGVRNRGSAALRRPPVPPAC